MRCPGWPCDTEHAINPAIWRTESEKVDPVELADRVIENASETGAYNICLTGGEPFLQKHDDLYRFLYAVELEGPEFKFEVFTNGSFDFPLWRTTTLRVIMDWKLPGSGEHETARSERARNARRLSPLDAVKFVCKDENDFQLALIQSVALRFQRCQAQFWVGRAWDTPLTDKRLVELMEEHKLHDWHLNIQLHKYIWPADERRV